MLVLAISDPPEMPMNWVDLAIGEVILSSMGAIPSWPADKQ